MDKKLKAKWIRALRSGKYKQARGALTRGPNHHCCIGVCAVLVDKSLNATGMENMFTAAAAQMIGITESERGSLVAMNDFERRTFKTIANCIEKHF
jgi:hypothetical protein